MRGLWYVLFLVLGAGLVAACGRDEDGGGIATAPSLASVSGTCSNVNSLVQAAFTGNNTTRNNVQSFGQQMVQAFGSNQKGKATWYGFEILNAIDTAGRFLGTLPANSDLAVATFPCMSLGTATLPTSVVTQLGETGAFGVRGRSAADNEAVIAHDGTWIIEPPEGKFWNDITTLQARTGITGDTANLFLALGEPGPGSGFAGTGDELLAGSFNWSTIPTATFGSPYVVVGQCDVGGGFLQHFPVSSSSAEIVGFVQPAQCPATSFTMERAPRSLAERLFRALSPAPAYAAALLKSGSGGGNRPSLSPFGIVKPGNVSLGEFTTSPKKSGNVKNQVFTPTPVINPKSAGGVAFKQASVLSYILPVVNKGSPGFVCFNWAYNDDEGETDFDRSYYTKAGGLQLRAFTIGTITTDESTGQPVPVVPASEAVVLSTSFNVKNSSIPDGVCPVFDGTTFFTDVRNPASGIPFDSEDPNTFPPNFDDPE